jgi:hypothetical protein
MKTKNFFTRKEKGQVIVLFVIIALTAVAFIALLVDGGMLMINKRQAQAAADAGALAGAKILCEGKPDPAGTAVSYATQNRATFASASIGGNFGYEVSVTTSVSSPSVFASLIGVPTITSNAVATAACIIPSNNVMPVAWYCPNPSAEYCGVDMFDWNVSHNPSGTLYLLADTSKMNEDDPWATCKDTTFITPKGVPVIGQMICDITANGIHVQVLGNGQREYITDVCQKVSNPAQCIADIINGVAGVNSLSLGWFPIHNGTIDKFYQNVAYGTTLTPPIVYKLPYYTAYTTSNVQISGVVGFMVTCASWQVNKTNGCTGKDIWLEANLAINKKFGGGRTMEGYFVKNHPVDLNDPGYIDALNKGLYYISLVE